MRFKIPVQHRIVTANLFVLNKHPDATVNTIKQTVRQQFDFLPDVIGCQETHGPHTLRTLNTVSNYDVFAKSDEGEAGLELGILLRDRLKHLGFEFHIAAQGVGEGTTNHDRGIYVIRYLKRGVSTAVVNCHAPVFGEKRAAEGKSGPAEEQHAIYADKVVKIVSRLRKNGWTVFVTADANSRAKWDRSLPIVLENAGMSITRDGVDIIAHDPKRVVRKDVQLITLGEPNTPEAAHEAIAARFIQKIS